MNEVEKQLLNAVEELLEQVRALQMQSTVQRSAYAALVRHLVQHGHVDAKALIQDIRTLGSAQDEEGWTDGHEEFAGLIALMSQLPSVRR